jgi:ribonuclease P protein component
MFSIQTNKRIGSKQKITSKFDIVVKKKQVPLACNRNKLKRQIKAIYRMEKIDFKSRVIIFYKGGNQWNFCDVRKFFLYAVRSFNVYEKSKTFRRTLDIK